MMTTHAPRIGITMGDPAGVGPEITVKALAVPEVAASCRAVVVGAGDALAAAIELLHAPLTLHRVKAVEDCRYAPGLEPQAVADTLGRTVAGVLRETAVDLLAVTGGETAFATIAAVGAALGTPRLDLDGAPASGLALGTLTLGAGSAARRVPFLSKAGGFGAPDLLLTLLGGSAS